MVVDLFDADALAGEDEAEVDLLSVIADAAAGGDRDGLVVAAARVRRSYLAANPRFLSP